MPKLLHITDTHVVAPPSRVSGILDTAGRLEACVSALVARLERLGEIDALLVTGDLSDDGSPESYALFRELVAPLGLQVLPVPGNHDAREPMREAFSDIGLFAEKGPLDWSVDLDGLRVVGLDTLVEGEGGGRLEEGTLAFLRDALKDVPQDHRIIVALHHPPFISGIRFMDGISLENRDAFADCLKASDRDIRVVCGHLHIQMTASVAGIPALSGPSPASVFDVDLRPDAPVGFLTGQGGVLLHDVQDGFRTVSLPLDVGDGPHPF